MTPSPSKLGVRLAAVALLVGVVGWAAGSLAVRNVAGSAIRDEAEQVSVGVAEQLANELDTRLDGLTETLTLLASRSEVAELTSGADVELSVAIRTVPEFDVLVLHSASGQVVAAAASDRVLSPGSVPPRPGLVDSLGESEALVDIADNGEATVEIVVPVEDPPGTVVGALSSRVPLEFVARALQVRLLGETARAVVVAPDGELLAHPNRDRVLNGERYPLDEITEGGGQVDVIDRDGVDTLAALATPTDFPGVVVVEEDEDDALARVGDELNTLTILLAIVVGATVFAVLILGNRLVRPLAGLVRTLRRIGEGDRSARADETGAAEFRAVATEVNQMADALDEQISALEAAERELRAAEVRFRTAFDEAPVAMALARQDERLVQVNPPMALLMGRTVEELQEQRLRDLVAADDRSEGQAALDRAIRTGSRMYRTERRYVRSDGTVIPTLTNVAIVRDDRGEPDYLIVHVVDLSELRAAEERFRQIVESSPDVLVIASLDGTVDMVNTRVTEVFGYAVDEIVGRSVELLVPERLRDDHVRHRHGYASDPRARDMGAGLRLFGRHANGSEIPVEVALSPIEIDGETKVIAAVRDVTERRRGEQVAQELREMQLVQRQAMEINDNVIQSLTVARWSFDLGHVEDARRAVERTVAAAQELIDRMLGASGEVEPGALKRERPAKFPR